MLLIRVKVRKIIEQKDNELVFEGSYTSGHELFSPKGFIAKSSNENLREGEIYIESNLKDFKIISFGEGHNEIMKKFFEDLKKLTNK